VISRRFAIFHLGYHMLSLFALLFFLIIVETSCQGPVVEVAFVLEQCQRVVLDLVADLRATERKRCRGYNDTQLVMLRFRLLRPDGCFIVAVVIIAIRISIAALDSSARAGIHSRCTGC
jgi:hypothetical protein